MEILGQFSAEINTLSLWCLAGQTLARILRLDWQWRILNLALAALLILSIVPMWQDA